MKQIKNIIKNFFIMVLSVTFTILFVYGSFFKLVPMLWHHGSSYAYQSMFTVILISVIALFYLIGFIIGAIQLLVESFKPTKNVSDPDPVQKSKILTQDSLSEKIKMR